MHAFLIEYFDFFCGSNVYFLNHEQAVERLEAFPRVMFLAKRGALRANVVAASYLIRKFGLSAVEALNHVTEMCPSTEGAHLPPAEALAAFPLHAVEALSAYETEVPFSILFFS